MARGEIKAASVAWATADELAPAQRVRAWSDRSAVQAGQKAAAASRNMSAELYWQAVAGHSSTVIPIPQPAQSAEEKEQAAPTVLIAAYVDLGRRDSLGRGLDAGSVATAVAADRAVQRERDALPQYCAGPIAICTLQSHPAVTSGQGRTAVEANSRHVRARRFFPPAAAYAPYLHDRRGSTGRHADPKAQRAGGIGRHEARCGAGRQGARWAVASDHSGQSDWRGGGAFLRLRAAAVR